MSKDCPEPRNLDNVQCRNCEKMGHFSKDCTEKKDWSKVRCNNCGESMIKPVPCSKLFHVLTDNL